MNVVSWFYSRNRALAQNKKVVTTTYTVRVGTTANLFIIDPVIDVADPADDFTLTVPDGVEIGQELVLVMSVNTNSKTCTVAFANHANTGSTPTASLDAADEYLKQIWTGSEWATLAYHGASDVA